MKVKINGVAKEVDSGTRLIDLVKNFEKLVENDPMIVELRKKTGSSHLLFILNGTVIQAAQYDTIEIKEDDDVRMVHPYFGG